MVNVSCSSIVIYWCQDLYYITTSLTFCDRFGVHLIFPSKASRYIVLDPNCTLFCNMTIFMCNLNDSATYCRIESLVNSKSSCIVTYLMGSKNYSSSYLKLLLCITSPCAPIEGVLCSTKASNPLCNNVYPDIVFII